AGWWSARGMVTDPGDVVDDAAGVVADREPLDVLALGGARAGADVDEAVVGERCRPEAAGQQVLHDLVREELHAAVGVVDDEPLLRTEELVGDDDRADGVVAGAAAGVADDVGIALAQPG